MDGSSGWKVERQFQQSLSQTSTRVLQSQKNIRVSTNLRQVRFPLIMEEGGTSEQKGGEGGQGMPFDLSSSPEMEMLKKKLDAMSSFSSSPFSHSLLNGSSTNAVAEMMSAKEAAATATTTSSNASGLLQMKMREVKAMKMQQSSFSSSSQANSSQLQQSIGEGLLFPSNSNAWFSNMNANMSVKMQDMMAAARSSSTSVTASASSTTLGSSHCSGLTSAAAAGVTRSFSSSSGFSMPMHQLPQTGSLISSSGGSLNSDGVDSGILSLSNAFASSNFPSSSFGGSGSSVSCSPLKRPFGFRNFDRPVWIDMPFINNLNGNSARDNQSNRMTWDPAVMLSMKNSCGPTTSGQVQFSASQQTFFEAYSSSMNGSFRTFNDQRLFLRQSYGASESESENEEDDDDDDSDFKSITYPHKPSLPYRQKLAICDKPSAGSNLVTGIKPSGGKVYEPSEVDDTSSIVPSDFELDVSPRDSLVEPESLPSTPEHRKCFKVAQELLTTERTYVKILHLIDQIFHFRVDQENRAQQMFPPETVTQIFCNVKSLYKLHSDHLLPKLEERLGKWEDHSKIGDIMTNFAPFLKMYSEYVQNFDNSINLINIYREKNARFKQIIDDIQKMEECGNLPIQHHLIGPIQRIPRYRLLLEAYIRRLPDDSPDRVDSEKALEIVSKAAEHANEAMRRIVGFKKLLEVQEKVKGIVDLVSPTRLFIKEGSVRKISARTGDHQERYMFLFSDLLLLCSSRPMNKVISVAPYQLRAKLDVGIINVAEGDDLEVENTFYVEDERKKIELYTSNSYEKADWMTAIHKAREELLERKSSLRLGSASPIEDDLGLKEPAKVKADTVTKCMECYTAFSMLRRKHHCHACGIVICSKCSENKVPLRYANSKPSRVCKRCRGILTAKQSSANTLNTNASSSEATTPDDALDKMKGVLDVPATAPSCVSGALFLRLRGKKEWTQRWFALRADFVLYCYLNEKEERSMTATPIPGMTVLMAEDLPKADLPNLGSNEKDRTFRIGHVEGQGRKIHFFLAPSRAVALQWVQQLNLASKAELQSNGSATKN